MAPGSGFDIRSNRVVFYSLIVSLAIVLWLAVMVFRYFLVILTVGGAVAMLLAPLNERLVTACRGRRTPAAALLVIATILIILIPLLAGATMIGSEAASLLLRIQPTLDPEALEELWSETLPTRYPWISNVKQWLQLDQTRIAEMISPALSRIASIATRVIQGTLAGLAQLLAQVVLFLFVLFFLLRDGPALTDALRSISPLAPDSEREAYEHLVRTIKGVLQSMVLVPLAQGLLAIIGFVIFGLPSPLFWGAMLIFAAIIPGIGSPLVWLPAGIYLISTGEAGRGVGVLIYGALVVSSIDNVLKPIILRGAARIHPLLGFLSIIGGILSFGILGFLIGPIILSLLLSGFRIYRMDLLNPQPSQTADTGAGSAR